MTSLHHTDSYTSEADLRRLRRFGLSLVAGMVAGAVILLGAMMGSPVVALLGCGGVVLAGLAVLGFAFYVGGLGLAGLCKLGKR